MIVQFRARSFNPRGRVTAKRRLNASGERQQHQTTVHKTIQYQGGGDHCSNDRMRKGDFQSSPSVPDSEQPQA
jgi:hypothetical protein